MKKELNIAIVEDDKVYSARVAHELKTAGHKHIKQYNDGISFLFDSKQLDPNLGVIILDYHLDEQINGLDVLTQIHEKSPNLKVIFLTGQSEIAIAIKAVKLGAYDYFEKNDSSFWKVINAVNKIVEEKEKLFSERKRMKKKAIFGFTLFMFFLVLFYFFNQKFKIL